MSTYNHKWQQHLDEISQANIDKVGWSENKLNDYAFGNLFGPHWRVAIPSSLNLSDVSADAARALGFGWLADIKNFLDDLNLEFRYRTTFRPGTKISEYRKIELNVAARKLLVSKDETNPKTGVSATRNVEMKVGKGLTAIAGLLKDVGHVRFSNQALAGAENWNRFSETIQNFVIVISRHPIDVLRMSDHPGLQSCHSQPQKDENGDEFGGIYFQCAIEEAQGHGFVGYLIKAADFEAIKDKLDSFQEIFADPERSVQGIRPISRVRARELHNEKDNYSLALPERKMYGTKIDSLLADFEGWIHEKQDSQVPKGMNPGDFRLLGGEYSDASYNTDEGLINLFVDHFNKQYNPSSSSQFDRESKTAIEQKVTELNRKYHGGDRADALKVEFYNVRLNRGVGKREAVEIATPIYRISSLSLAKMFYDKFLAGKTSIAEEALVSKVAERTSFFFVRHWPDGPATNRRMFVQTYQEPQIAFMPIYSARLGSNCLSDDEYNITTPKEVVCLLEYIETELQKIMKPNMSIDQSVAMFVFELLFSKQENVENMLRYLGSVVENMLRYLRSVFVGETLQESKKGTLLKEVSDYPLGLILNWMKKAQPSDYAFNELFDGKWRVAVPYKSSLAELDSISVNNNAWPKQLGIINGIAKASEFKIDYLNDLVVRNYVRVNPKDGKEYPSVEKYTIGTFLGRFFKNLEKMPLDEKKIQLYQSILTNAGAYESIETEYIRHDGYTDDNNGRWVSSRTEKKKRTPEEAFSSLKDLDFYPLMLTVPGWWNENSFRYIKKQAETEGDYAIIVSRHPIDILRMSDHSNIRSCHSEESDFSQQYRYFYCALQEAQGHGPVVYLVHREDAANLVKEDGLQEDEIFRDRDRAVPGIEPVGRLRLREVRNDSEGFSIALPEKPHAYGDSGTSGTDFFASILEWLHEKQDPILPESLRAVLTDKSTPINLSDYQILGGSYIDTEARGDEDRPAHTVQSASGWAEYFRRYFGADLRTTGRLSKDEAPDLGYRDPQGRADHYGDDDDEYEEQERNAVDEGYVRRAVERYNEDYPNYTLEYDSNYDDEDNEYYSWGVTVLVEFSSRYLKEELGEESLSFSEDAFNEISDREFCDVFYEVMPFRVDSQDSTVEFDGYDEHDQRISLYFKSQPGDYLNNGYDDVGEVDYAIREAKGLERDYDKDLRNALQQFLLEKGVIDASGSNNNSLIEVANQLQHFEIKEKKWKSLSMTTKFALLPVKIPAYFLTEKTKHAILSAYLYAYESNYAELIGKALKEYFERGTIDLRELRLSYFNRTVRVNSGYLSEKQRTIRKVLTGKMGLALEQVDALDPGVLEIDMPMDSRPYTTCTIQLALNDASIEAIQFVDENIKILSDAVFEEVFKEIMQHPQLDEYLISSLGETIARKVNEYDGKTAIS